MKRIPYPLLIAAGCGSILGLAGCSDDDNNPINDEGSLTVYVADAPVDFANRVKLRFSGARVTSADGEKTMITQAANAELLATATGDPVKILDSKELDEGDYSRIELFIDDSADANFVELDSNGDGTMETYPLIVEGGSIDSKAAFSVSETGGDSILIDIDLRQSLSGDAESGSFQLNPVVRQHAPGDLGKIGGTINTEGVADLKCESEDARVAVYVYQGQNQVPGDVAPGQVEDEPYASGILNDATGEYLVQYLPEGQYSVAYTCQAAADRPDAQDTLLFSDVQNVTVTAGDTAAVNF